MQNLSNYFLPLTSTIFIETVAVIFCLDIIGSAIAGYIKMPRWTRSVWWFMGVGVWAFIFFVVNLFLPLSFPTAMSSLLVPTLFFSRPYFEKNKFLDLLRSLFQNPWFWLITLPLVPVAFIKSSTPPYQWDEMAYHYISPFVLNHAEKWAFSGALYDIIIQSVDNFYRLLFALFHTYSPARFLNFVIFITTTFSLSLFISNKTNRFYGLLLPLLMFYFPGQPIIQMVTSGYVDMPTACFFMIGFFLLFEVDSLIPALSYLSLAASGKYAILIPITATAPILIYNLKKITKYFVRAIPIFIILGGFWYLKNLYFVHNPIYPLPYGKSFFSGWTTYVTVSTLPRILLELLPGSKLVLLVCILSTITGVIFSKSIIRKIVLSTICFVIIDFFIINKTSGFLVRYYWHLQPILIVLSVLSIFPDLSDNKYLKYWKYFLVILLLSLGIRNMFRTSFQSYQQIYRNRQETYYFLGRIDIYQWIKNNYPRLGYLPKWCESNPGEVVLMVIDPELIWYEQESLVRIFFTNCNNTSDPSVLKQKQKKFLISLTPCESKAKIYPTDGENEYYRLNQSIVCSSKQIEKYLYEIK